MYTLQYYARLRQSRRTIDVLQRISVATQNIYSGAS